MMKQRYFITLLWLLSGTQVSAQCYQNIYAKAQSQFQSGKYAQAAKSWGAAKGCPDKPANNDLEARIRQANEQVAAKNKKEEKSSVSPTRSKPVEPQKPVSKPASKPAFTPTAPNIEMVSVQGGTFQMGSNDSEARSNEKPVHTVTVSSFQIGKYEVTQAQWRAVMGNSPSYFKNCDNCPVEHVSWDDVQQFISKLNSLSSKRYRLPTEAEWEYAARGGSSSNGYKYSGSNELNNFAWYDGNSGNKTHSVGTRQANELGIYDMSGNVWEWCQDWYDSSYYSSSPQSNPIGAAKGSFRVFRGGGWFDLASDCRASNRSGNTPAIRGSTLGFRLVWSLQ